MEWVFIGLTIILWGISPVFDKMALKTIEPVIAVAIRMMIAGSIMFLYVLFFEKIKIIKKISVKYIMLFVMSSSFSLLGFVFYFKALSGGYASKIVPAVATYPLLTAVIAFIFMRESFSFKKLLGIVLIISGVILLK